MGCKAEKPKQKHKKGLWSPDEDQKLRDYILRHGHGCWSSVPVNAGLQRNGKSCRLRWINYLRPGLKRGVFTLEEEETVLALHGMLGNKWSQISQHLPGRTDNEIKNHWHSYLKKRVSKQDIISSTTKADHENTSSGGGGGSMGNLLESSYSPNSPSLIPKSSTTQNSAVFLESFEQHLDQGSSSTDTEPSVSLQQMDYFPADHHHHQGHVSLMPKILFAEWLSMDTFRDQLQNAPIINYVGKHNFDYYNNNSDFHDAFMLINHGDDDQQLFFQEENFGSSHVDINHRGGGGGGEGGSGQLISSNDIVTVDNNNNNNNMIQTTPKFEVDHFSENGFVDFISGQFNITSDEMYL